MELFGRRPPRKPRRNIAAHVFLGLAAAAVIVLIFTRGGSDQPDPGPDRQQAAAEATTSSPASSAPVEDAGGPPAAVETSTAAETSAAAETAPEEADGGVPDEEPQGAGDPGAAAEPAPEEEQQQEEPAAGLSAEASQYLLALSAFAAAADGLVSDMGAVNRSWDEEKGDAPDEPSYRARYREAESALEDILDRVRGFTAGVRNQPVPAPVALQGGALAEQAARLPGLAEDVLAGLRRPRPDDGSARRAALADFNAAAAGFSRSAAALAARIEQDAAGLGLAAGGTASDAAPSGAQPQPDEADAAAYLEGLAGFRDELNRLAADIGEIHRSWDEEKGDAPDEPSYRARYREAESALEDALRRMRSFHVRVQALPVPSSVQALGAGPESLTPRLVSSAEGMLAGLRRPRPDDGSARRAALADFDEAVRSFGVMVDRLAAAGG